MYRYLDYFIKCIIRQITRLIFKPKIFISILVILLILFLWFCNSSMAVYQGDDTYTDPNNTIYLAYKTINSDLINRLSNTNSSTLSSVINNLKRSDRSYYIYYGEPNGSSLINSSTYNTNDLFIAFYPSSSQSSSTTFDNYQGISSLIRLITNTTAIFKINSDGITQIDAQNFYIPSVLINYYDSSLVDFINNSSSKETSEIVSAIENQTNTIQQQTQVIEQQTESLTSTDFDENEVAIDSSSADIDNSQQQGLFTTIFNNFNNAISSDDVEYLQIPLVNNQGLRIPSDIVSSHLGELTSLINAFWFYLFGLYAFKFVNNLIIKIKDGSILDGYTSNEVISSDMM